MIAIDEFALYIFGSFDFIKTYFKLFYGVHKMNKN